MMLKAEAADLMSYLTSQISWEISPEIYLHFGWFFFLTSVVSRARLIWTRLCIIGMEIDTAESILETKSMDSEPTTSPMAIATKDHGTKGESKAMECIHSETELTDLVNGIMGI